MRRLTTLALLLACAAGAALAANEYETAALAKARKDGLTASAVAGKKYADIATLAGVTLGPKGESPAKFFYVHVRRYVRQREHRPHNDLGVPSSIDNWGYLSGGLSRCLASNRLLPSER